MAEDWSIGYARATSEADYVPPRGTAGDPRLNDVQADAILNMRLRSLRRLEEMELRAERDTLADERSDLLALLDDTGSQWNHIATELKETKRRFGRDNPNGARRTRFSEAAETPDLPPEAMVEREPVTVVCSRLGWIRAMRGHLEDDSKVKFRDGDEARFQFHAETTDRLMLFGSNGRAYTIAVSNLPGGRGLGEPVRLMIDLPNEAEILDVFVHDPEREILVASSAGDGFVAPEGEMAAQTRAGRQVLNVREGVVAKVCRPVGGDHVAVVGENRKLLVFPLSELPRMNRGKGVRLQRYKDGDLSDARSFDLAEGLSWRDPADRVRSEMDLTDWIGARAGTGRMAPRGFPRDNRFN
jgi:topoisomerase-4 subunit A